MKHNKIILAMAMMMLGIISLKAQKIGLLMDSYVVDRWYIDQKLFTDRVKELGGECLVEVPYGDPDEQVRLGKKLIAAGVQVLVIVPTDAKKAAAVVEAAKAANIPVIAYDRLIDTKDLTFYISYSNPVVGDLQAKYALRKVPAGNYLLINGPVSDNNAIVFRNGQLKALESAINKKKVKVIGDIVLDGWSEIETMMKMDEFLSGSKVQPDVIIAANDAIANGALQSLPKELIGKVVITGQDAEMNALKNIINGSQAMTIYKPIKPLAFQAAECAIKLAKGEKIMNTIKVKNGDVEVDAIQLNPVVVDKANYKETVVKDGHVNLSELLEKK
jgi:D-xylose transport system substrate-binding protein